MRYGVIGLGNMASAILKGMVESGNFKNDELTGYDMSGEKTLAAQTAFGLLPAADARAEGSVGDDITCPRRHFIRTDAVECRV